MRHTVLWLALTCAVTACTPAVRAPIEIAAQTADRVAKNPASRVEDNLRQAQSIVQAQGSADLKATLSRLDEAMTQTGQPGGVALVIEPTRSADSGGLGAERSRVVFLRPGFYDDVMGYNLVIDQTKMMREKISPAELALYLYSAALRREYDESYRSRNLRGTALLDAISTAPPGQTSAQLKSHEVAWEKTLEQGYRPWRSAGIVGELANFETLSKDQVYCKTQADYAGCWAASVRHFLGV